MSRPAIPADLERSLMIEAGYRCAVCKNTEPLEIDHIVDWAKVQEHKFDNMIVLCANCHGRKKNSSDPRHINTASLSRVKQDLMMLNGRYSDLERRLIENFKRQLDRPPHTTKDFHIHEALIIMVHYLIKDGIAAIKHHTLPLPPDGTRRRNTTTVITINLTPKGREFVMGLAIRPREDAQ